MSLHTYTVMNNIHPKKRTWKLKMKVWKMIFLFKGVIFRFHVSFWGGICRYIYTIHMFLELLQGLWVLGVHCGFHPYWYHTLTLKHLSAQHRLENQQQLLDVHQKLQDSQPNNYPKDSIINLLRVTVWNQQIWEHINQIFKMGPCQTPSIGVKQTQLLIYFRPFIGAPCQSIYNDHRGPSYRITWLDSS